MKRLTEKNELAEAIKGGGTTSNGFTAKSTTIQETFSPILNTSNGTEYQNHMQRAFLESAMVQNLQIQQQLLAQNQALQNLLSQQETSGRDSSQSPPSISGVTKVSQKQNMKGRVSSSPFAENDRHRKASSEMSSRIPIPPPMPPPLEFNDPSGARPFLDPYGRAKTVRIGKWRWPPPQDGIQVETDDNFMQFKMRQHHRKNTPQSNTSSPNGSAAQIEWDEFEIENVVVKNNSSSNGLPPRKFSQGESVIQTTTQVTKVARRSFEIGADRPPPGSVGKLKLSSEMRQRLEQVTAGHSVRSSNSTKSDQRAPAKLEDARRMMLQQQLSGHFGGGDKLDGGEMPSVRNQVKRMEVGKRGVVPPAPSIPAPPPPIRPPTSAPPNAPSQLEMPAFFQRQERDTFGIHQSQSQWNGSEISKDTYDSWGRAEAVKHELYEGNYKKETKNERERERERERSRSRSRSRDRENFSEAVWDRNEVEGPPSTGSEHIKEREKRERMYEMKQVERERESQKVYHPPTAANKSNAEKSMKKTTTSTSATTQMQERATFKTHMAQRMDRDRKTSASTMLSQSTDKPDDSEFDLPSPANAVPAPVPPPTSIKSPAAACMTYNRVPWRLRVRKEVFHPTESIPTPATLDLLFAQVTGDVFGATSCLRISGQEKRNAINLLSNHGILAENVQIQSIRAIVKRHLIDMARSWPLYFARLFIVSGSPQFPDVSILAVSHSGVYLARRDNETLSVVLPVPFSELHGAATLPRPAALQLNLKNGNRIVLHAPRASAIQSMIQTFIQEFKQVSTFLN